MIAGHILIFFASYLAFSVAVITGVAFLVRERRLKRKDPRVLSADAVSLELLDRVNLFAVVAGFFLFSAGIAWGSLLARKEWGGYFTGDPMEVASTLTWAAYAGVLGLRLTAGLKGRRVVLLSVMSFLFVLFTFLGVRLVVSSRHFLF